MQEVAAGSQRRQQTAYSPYLTDRCLAHRGTVHRLKDPPQPEHQAEGVCEARQGVTQAPRVLPVMWRKRACEIHRLRLLTIRSCKSRMAGKYMAAGRRPGMRP